MSPRAAPGRPEDKLFHYEFLLTAQFIEENNEEQTTVGELVQKMGEFLLADSNMQPCSSKPMRRKLMELFGHEIIIYCHL